MNVRSGPGTTYSILGRLNQGQTIVATGKTADGQWLQVTYNGAKAFVFAAYTTFSTGAAPAAAAVPAAAAPAPPRCSRPTRPRR
ncbi:MAG: SH3 domain-containing protein [Anaerolineae bacterium]|nr:SH3 domain-containing protein [Anaerolineae bacterium]